jgi:hypothetical protein
MKEWFPAHYPSPVDLSRKGNNASEARFFACRYSIFLRPKKNHCSEMVGFLFEPELRGKLQPEAQILNYFIQIDRGCDVDMRNTTLKHYWLYLGYSPQETKKALNKCREGRGFRDICLRNNMKLSSWERDDTVAYIFVLESRSLLVIAALQISMPVLNLL